MHMSILNLQDQICLHSILDILFVCVDALCPSQQYFSHVWMFP